MKVLLLLLDSPGSDNDSGDVNYNSGHVEIHKYNGGTNWVKVLGDINCTNEGYRSGQSVSLSSDGSIVAIGSQYADDGPGNNSGQVKVYKNTGSIWELVGSAINGEASGDKSGFSVSLSSDGKIVAIGAPTNDGGHVIIREYNNVSDTWEKIGIAIPGYDDDDECGYSVSLSDDGRIVAIGSRDNDLSGNNSGQVRIFENIGDTWTLVGSSINGVEAGDFCGVLR